MPKQIGKIILKILGTFLRSMFISMVMFLIVYSVITGQFPPSLSQLTKTYNNLDAMSHLSKKLVEKQHSPHKRTKFRSDSAENDVNTLQAFYRKRAELGTFLLPENKPEMHFKSRSDKTNFSTVSEQRLLSRIRELEFDLYRLQQRVIELENKSHTRTTASSRK